MMSFHPTCSADQCLSIMQCTVNLHTCRYVDKSYVVGMRNLLCSNLLVRS